MQKIVTKFLNSEKFEYSFKWEAIVYRTIIDILCQNYCKENIGFDSNRTHSEYWLIEDSEKINLVLCIWITETYTDKSWKEDCKDIWYSWLKEYIEKYIDVIPSNIRKRYNMYIGYNYWTLWGILINDKEIKLISQEEFMKVPTTDAIGIVYNTIYDNFFIDFKNKINEKIKPSNI